MRQFTWLVLVLAGLTPAVFGQEFENARLDNWHQWRGPEANGFVPRGHPPLRWDEKTNVQWKTRIPGKGSATPIIWGDRVFVATAVDTGRPADPKDLPRLPPRADVKTRPSGTYHQFVVLCLDRASGRVLWQKTATEQVPHEGHHETHSYAAASPVTDGRRLFVSFGSRGIFCFDLDGNLQWQTRLGTMNTRYGWGEGSSPALDGDTLFVNWDHEGDSFLAALDASNGKVRWKADRDEPTSWSTPLVVRHNGRSQVIVSGTNRIRSYDPASGKLLWQGGGLTVNVIPCPVVAGGLVVCMSGYRGSAAHAIPLDTADGDTPSRWTLDRGTPYVPSPVLVGDRLYFTQGNTGLLSCVEVRTGKVRIDRERLPGLTSVYASPVSAAGRIYFTGRDGTTVVIKADDSLEVLAVNRLPEAIDASPAIVGRHLFLRGHQHMYCIAEK